MPLAGLRVLCVDNDAEILAGMRTLLVRWQVQVGTAATVEEALAAMADAPQVLLVDYHLHDRHDGLDIEDAYAIQSINIERRVAAGQKIIGRKVGLTSKPMQSFLRSAATAAGREFSRAIFGTGRRRR